MSHEFHIPKKCIVCSLSTPRARRYSKLGVIYCSMAPFRTYCTKMSTVSHNVSIRVWRHSLSVRAAVFNTKCVFPADMITIWWISCTLIKTNKQEVVSICFSHSLGRFHPIRSRSHFKNWILKTTKTPRPLKVLQCVPQPRVIGVIYFIFNLTVNVTPLTRLTSVRPFRQNLKFAVIGLLVD